VTVAKEKKRPAKSAKAPSFSKARLKRLPQAKETWEADFRALPKPISQSATHYLGVVVSARDVSLLAETQVAGRPSASDLSELLIRAMLQPLAGQRRRPHSLRLRRHPQWRELFPRLDEIGIKVTVRRELPKARKAHENHLRQLREVRRARMVRPAANQSATEALFPAVAEWVRGYGHIEIGEQEMFGFVARALSYGGEMIEDDKAETLSEALAALDKLLTAWFKKEEIGIG
jgi:hypothetical protein